MVDSQSGLAGNTETIAEATTGNTAEATTLKANEVVGVVTKVAGKTFFKGTVETRGFMTEDGAWHTVNLKNFSEEVIKIGNRLKFAIVMGLVNTESIEVLEVGIEVEGHKSWTDDMTDFETLLDTAHENIKEIRTGILEEEEMPKGIPIGTVIFRARVITMDDKVFEAHGDANPENVSNEIMQKHYIRIAETRALARALRFMTNNAKVAVEETEGKSGKEKK